MNIDRKVIEQALEALINAVPYSINNAFIQEQATKALREALAQPQPVRDVEISNTGRPFTVKAYTSPQPQPQPQPVQQDHYKELAALGWQAIECPVCGSSAQGYPRQAAQPLAETQSDSLNTLCKMLHSGEEVEGDDGLAMLVPMDLWNEAQDAIELLIGEDDGTEAAHGITKGTT